MNKQEPLREECFCPYCGKQCFLKKPCLALKAEDEWAEEGGKRGPKDFETEES